MTETKEIRYQGHLHELQKQLMGDYYAQLTAIATGRSDTKNAHLLIAGNPVELVRAFGMIPVFPEVNVLQLAVRKQSLPLIQKAEELGYAVDNCAYVKADVGLYLSGYQAPYGTIPKADLLLCNYVGCNVYLNWFEHLAELTGAPAVNIDIPFVRSADGEPSPGDVDYVVKQLEELIVQLENITGTSLDMPRLRRTVENSALVGEMWAEIKDLTKRRPAPYDAYFDSVTMMAVLYCLRGTDEAVTFFEAAREELSRRAAKGEGPLPEERFRVVIEGPPPWPFLRVFRDMFSRWGAVAVASTYSTVGGIWEFGFRHDPQRPIESIARHMLQYNLCNRTFLQRYDQMARYVDEWSADAVVIHSVKSCRLFSAGQGDMREYFVREREVPTLLIESDLEDPRYFSQAQLRNRIDAFFEALSQRRLTAASDAQLAAGGAR
ncbi:MAG TPA: 2-hydroxyacyl-CoA dehydratase family protein [Candidatus Limnocylindria bacterium]